MAVGAGEKNRVARRNFIQIGTGRELRRFPESLDPAAAGDPFPALGSRDALIFYRDGLGVRLTLVNGVNVPVDQNKIDIHSTPLRFAQGRFFAHAHLNGKAAEARYKSAEKRARFHLTLR